MRDDAGSSANWICVSQILPLSAPRTDGQGQPAGESTIYLYPSRGSLRRHFVLKTRVFKPNVDDDGFDAAICGGLADKPVHCIRSIENESQPAPTTRP